MPFPLSYQYSPKCFSPSLFGMERFVAYGPSPASGSVYKLRFFLTDFMKEMFVCLWPADKIGSGEVADHFELSRFHHCIVKCSIVAL